MKKSLFFIYTLVVAFIFTSCEGLENLGGSNVKITSPYTDIVVSNVVCEGWSDGEVWLEFDIVSTQADLELWFGSFTATANNVTYTTEGNIAFRTLYEGDKTTISYYGQDSEYGDGECAFFNVPTNLTQFDEVKIPISVTGIDDIKYIILENVKIDWQ